MPSALTAPTANDLVAWILSFKTSFKIFLEVGIRGNINGTGLDDAEAFNGNGGDNVLTGGGGADDIEGLDGNDKLLGSGRR